MLQNPRRTVHVAGESSLPGLTRWRLHTAIALVHAVLMYHGPCHGKLLFADVFVTAAGADFCEMDTSSCMVFGLTVLTTAPLRMFSHIDGVLCCHPSVWPYGILRSCPAEYKITLTGHVPQSLYHLCNVASRIKSRCEGPPVPEPCCLSPELTPRLQQQRQYRHTHTHTHRYSGRLCC